MDKNYGGVIWTNHALQRLSERGIKQGDAWATWSRPEQSRYAASQNAWVYYRTWGSTKIEVVAKQDERKQWIILSVWSKPVYTGGTNRAATSHERVSPWGMIKRLFGKK